MNPEDIKQLINDEIDKKLGFTIQKITDTPTDNLAVTSRKYVNMYGSIVGRPQNSVIGQQYFDTTNGYPIFRNSNYQWVNSVGSVIG